MRWADGSPGRSRSSDATTVVRTARLPRSRGQARVPRSSRSCARDESRYRDDDEADLRSARGEWIYFAPADGQDPAAALVARARRRRPRRRPSDPAARSGGARAHRRAVFGRPPANLPPAGWRGRRRGALPWPGAASLPCRGDFFEAEMLIARRTAHALGDLCSSGCAISFAAAELDGSAALFVDRRRAVSPPARGRATRPRSRPAAASRTPRARPGARWMSHRPASGGRA